MDDFDRTMSGSASGSARSRSERSISALLSDLAREIRLLVRQEVALFKAELAEKLSRLGRGVAAIAVGGLIAFSGWLVLLAAAVLALWLAALIIGLVVLAIGGALLFFGSRRLDVETLVPRRTLASLREDEAWLKERIP